MLNHLTLYPIIISFVFILLNLFVFMLFYIDKKRAIKNKSRVSEKTLLIYAFLGGGLGAFFGMTYFRHKTQKAKFKIAVPIAAFISLLLLLYFLFI